MWTLTAAFFFFAIPFLNRTLSSAEKIFALRVAFGFMTLAGAFGVFQFFANNFMGLGIYNFFGPLQAHPHFGNTILGIDRSTSVFIEPSQFAWVSLFFIALAAYLYKNRVEIGLPRWRWHLLVVIFGLLASLSAVGYIGFVILAAILVFEERGRLSSRYLYGVSAFLGGLVGLVLTGAYRFLRLDTIAVEGTSGFQRLIAPFLALRDTLEHYPLLGRGLGQQGVADLLLANSEEIIHNAVFGFWIVFGLFGGALILFFFAQSYIKNLWAGKAAILPLFMLAYMYLSTGAFIALEIPFLLTLASFAVSLAAERDRNRASHKPPPAVEPELSS
jgi:hypothetical protein